MQAIVDFFQTIYRVGPDRPNVWIYEWTDWMTVIAIALMIQLILAHYRKSDAKQKKRMKTAMVVIVWLHLISRYGLSRQFYDFGERLPFYSCSLAAIIFALSPFIPRRKAWQQEIYNWAAFAGIYGGILAVGFSSPGVYLAPHITSIDYYVGHTMIILLGLIEIMDRRFLFDRHTLRFSSLVTMSYLLIARVLDIFWNTNFGFMNVPPSDIPFLAVFPLPIYRLGVVFCYVLANFLIWYFANRYLRKVKKIRVCEYRPGEVAPEAETLPRTANAMALPDGGTSGETGPEEVK